MLILVTGGTGYIGAHIIVELIKVGHSDYFTSWNAPIRNKENGNPKQGTHQS